MLEIIFRVLIRPHLLMHFVLWQTSCAIMERIVFKMRSKKDYVYFGIMWLPSSASHRTYKANEYCLPQSNRNDFWYAFNYNPFCLEFPQNIRNSPKFPNIYLSAKRQFPWYVAFIQSVAGLYLMKRELFSNCWLLRPARHTFCIKW